MCTRTVLLGIDIGTSACKAALYTEDGAVVAQESAEYPLYYPAPGFAEQDPEAWWRAVCVAVRGAMERGGVEASEVAAVGVDGQSWSAIPVDDKGHVLARTPIWTDTRAKAICETARRDGLEDALFDICGNPFEPTYSLPKMLWFKENRPEVYDGARAFLQSNSFIVYRLTGCLSQDVSQGYGLQCFDMHRGAWDEAAARQAGIDPRLLPEIFPCHAVVGGIAEVAARQTGLLAGTPVVAGGLDAACGTLGAGVVHEGETQEQGGQAGGMSICAARYVADRRLILSFHVVPGRWLLQGGTVGGGGMLRWLREAMCPELSFEQMSALAETISPGSDGLLCLPYMAGERSPIWDPDAKGIYFGLSYDKGRAHLVRAAMEGVAFSLLHNLETAREAGCEPDVLRAMGGAANSAVWTQIKADITGKRIEVPASDTATSLGAAILAGMGVGIYGSAEEAVRKAVRLKRTHLPNAENGAAYAKGYQKYRALYGATKNIMREASGK